ncbi:glutaredoxin [Gayadomonas joobiniege]|uniref:glutaredoxin n=1 Tax=Gayadomonas joobiniege TaxID=1234606 RepID=UPI00036F0590|nr:glutaredoxin [Gayadomonas joobiniege]
MKLNIEIYSKGYCPFCKRTKATLKTLGLPFKEFDITSDAEKAKEMRSRSGRRTVPQVFINGKHIGGSDEFHHALDNGLLKELSPAL